MKPTAPINHGELNEMTEYPDDVKTDRADGAEAEGSVAEADDPMIKAATRRRVRLRNAVLEIIGYGGPDDDPGWFTDATDIGAELREQFPRATTAELREAISDASGYVDHDIDELHDRIEAFTELRDRLTNAEDWVEGNDEEEDEAADDEVSED